MLLQREMRQPADIILGKHKQPHHISKIGSVTGPGMAGRLWASSTCALGTHCSTTGCARDKSRWGIMSPYSAVSFSSSTVVRRLQLWWKERLERDGAAWQWKVGFSLEIFVTALLEWLTVAYPTVTWTQPFSAPNWNKTPINVGKGNVVGEAELALFILWMVLLCCTNSREGPQSSEHFRCCLLRGGLRMCSVLLYSQISHKSCVLWLTCSPAFLRLAKLS